MIELFKSLFARPRLAVLLLTSSLIISVLSLVPAFYVIIVLNKYMASGVFATLFGLTTGTVMAVVLEFAFRQNRSTINSLWLSECTKELFMQFKTKIQDKVIQGQSFQKLVSDSRLIDGVNKNNIVTYVLDWPFQLFLLVVLFVLSWTAGIVAVLFVLLLYTLEKYKKVTQFKESTSQNIELCIMSLVTVAVISVGSYHVMNGALNIGALIGSNILAARFVQSSQKFFKACKLVEARSEAIKRLDTYIHTGSTA